MKSMGKFTIKKREYLLFLLGAAAVCAAPAKSDPTITVPSTIDFAVYNSLATTVGQPNPFTISFTGASPAPGNSLIFSVVANNNTLTSVTSTSTIPVGYITWTCSTSTGKSYNSPAAPNGLSMTEANVYASAADAASGSANVVWSLAPIGLGVAAGQYTLIGQWKITEGLQP